MLAVVTKIILSSLSAHFGRESKISSIFYVYFCMLEVNILLSEKENEKCVQMCQKNSFSSCDYIILYTLFIEHGGTAHFLLMVNTNNIHC